MKILDQIESRLSEITKQRVVGGHSGSWPGGQINMRATLDWTSSSWLISDAAQRYSHYQSILMIVSPPLGSMLVNSEEGICAAGRCFTAVCDIHCESSAIDISCGHHITESSDALIHLANRPKQIQWNWETFHFFNVRQNVTHTMSSKKQEHNWSTVHWVRPKARPKLIPHDSKETSKTSSI